MFTLTLSVPALLAGPLAAHAQETEQEVEDAVIAILHKHFETTEKTEPTDWMSALVLATEAAERLPVGTEFELSYLIPTAQWNLIAPGGRKQLGKKFRQTIEERGIAKFVMRRSDNHAIYCKL